MALRSKGYEVFESKVQNFNGIIKKLEGIIDTSDYEEKLQEIYNDLNRTDISGRNMPTSTMRDDYEHYSLTPFNERVEALTDKLEEELLPFYEVHLLSNQINSDVENINEANAEQIVNDTITLIKKIIELNAHNRKDLTHIIDKAYKSIYKVILNEEMLDKNEVLKYVMNINNDQIREALGRLIEKDIKDLPKGNVIREELKNIKKEGLGYDFLTPGIIREIALLTLSDKNENFKIRKEKAAKELASHINEVVYARKEVEVDAKDNKSEIRGLRLRESALTAKILSFVLVPIIGIVGGHELGKALSNRIDEYKTVTRTVNYETKKQIGEENSVYDEHETTYTATVKECTPWRKNPSGIGYVRNVKAYEFRSTEGKKEFDIEEIKNAKEKYKYMESKDVLDADENTTDSVILVTETFQDKNDTRKSTKYILPFSIVGGVLGIGIEVLLAFLGLLSPEKLSRSKRELFKQLRDKAVVKDRIKEEKIRINDQILSIQEEYKEKTTRYGNIDEITMPEIEPAAVKYLHK